MDNKLNGRIPQDEMDLAYQKTLASHRSKMENSRVRLREELAHMIELLNENVDHIGAFSVVFVTNADDSLVDPFDADDPTTDGMGRSVACHKGTALLLADAMKDQIRYLESSPWDTPSIPNLLAGFLGTREGEEPEAEEE